MDIIKNLTLLNSKERFYLFTYATNRGKFELTKDFKDEINKTIHVKIPDNYFAAIDYHLDWLFAAITQDIEKDCNKEIQNTEGLITGNQEDIDLLIAFEEDSIVTIVMVEAKGVGSWTNKQISSKTKRLNKIFKDSKERNINPYLILMSPQESEGLEIEGNNIWTYEEKGKKKYYWINMELPKTLYKVGRKSKAHTEKWIIRQRKSNNKEEQ